MASAPSRALLAGVAGSLSRQRAAVAEPGPAGGSGPGWCRTQCLGHKLVSGIRARRCHRERTEVRTQGLGLLRPQRGHDRGKCLGDRDRARGPGHTGLVSVTAPVGTDPRAACLSGVGAGVPGAGFPPGPELQGARGGGDTAGVVAAPRRPGARAHRRQPLPALPVPGTGPLRGPHQAGAPVGQERHTTQDAACGSPAGAAHSHHPRAQEASASFPAGAEAPLHPGKGKVRPTRGGGTDTRNQPLLPRSGPPHDAPPDVLSGAGPEAHALRVLAARSLRVQAAGHEGAERSCGPPRSSRWGRPLASCPGDSTRASKVGVTGTE